MEAQAPAPSLHRSHRCLNTCTPAQPGESLQVVLVPLQHIARNTAALGPELARPRSVCQKDFFAGGEARDEEERHEHPLDQLGAGVRQDGGGHH